MFWSKNKKKIVYPCNPQFYYIKVGCKGVFVTRTCFPDDFVCLKLHFLAFVVSDFIWDFGKLPFSEHLGKYFIKNEKISDKVREFGKIKAIFGLGMTPI